MKTIKAIKTSEKVPCVRIMIELLTKNKTRHGNSGCDHIFLLLNTSPCWYQNVLLIDKWYLLPEYLCQPWTLCDTFSGAYFMAHPAISRGQGTGKTLALCKAVQTRHMFSHKLDVEGYLEIICTVVSPSLLQMPLIKLCVSFFELLKSRTSFHYVGIFSINMWKVFGFISIYFLTVSELNILRWGQFNSISIDCEQKTSNLLTA